jgi:hypothetical protein
VGLRHFGFLVLTQTTANNTDAKKYCNPKLLIPDVHFLQYAPPQFYGSDPSVPHHTSAPTLHIYSFKYKHNYSAKLLVQRRIATSSQVVPKTKNPPSFSPLLSIYLFLSLSTTFVISTTGLPIPAQKQQHSPPQLEALLLCLFSADLLPVHPLSSARRRSFHLSLFNAASFLAITRVASFLNFITHRPRE